MMCPGGKMTDIQCHEAVTDDDYISYVEATCSLEDGLQCIYDALIAQQCHDYKIRYYCSCFVTSSGPTVTPSSGQFTNPTPSPSGGSFTNPNLTPSGGQFTNPTPSPSGGISTLPTLTPSGGQYTNPTPSPSVEQYTNPTPSPS